MYRILTTLLFVFSIAFSFGQTYAYSFEGILTQEQSSKLTEEISQLNAVLNCEIRIKAESKGELIFSIDPLENRGENDHPFSPVDIKALLIRNNLSPIEFRQIK
jgi:DNA topoisomerase VI subunit A